MDRLMATPTPAAMPDSISRLEMAPLVMSRTWLVST